MKERHRLCKRNLSMSDKIFTIGDGLSQLYQYYYSVNPVVIMSAPEYVDVKKSTETNSKKIKIVHHGVANRNRKIENMIEIVSRAEKRYHLDLYHDRGSTISK